MTVRLRPHHLLCILTFVGEGYSPAFVTNFEAVVSRIVEGKEAVQVVDGPDDVCAPLLDNAACHCRESGAEQRDRLAAVELTEVLQQPVQAGISLQLQPSTLNLLRTAFSAGSIRAACKGCKWHPLCDSIAEAQFKGTKLLSGSL